MRGKARWWRWSWKITRITPACAGKRCSLRLCPRSSRDHPRMCGEKLRNHRIRQLGAGSPPHVRGKGTEEVIVIQVTGITPACAGKSPLFMVYPARYRDHPRMCGEKKSFANSIEMELGSPPHVRGKVAVQSSNSHQFRITPACAGKRLKRSRSTVPPVAIVPLFPSVCNKPVVSDGSPAGRDAPLFLPAENAVPASPAYNLRSL